MPLITLLFTCANFVIILGCQIKFQLHEEGTVELMRAEAGLREHFVLQGHSASDIRVILEAMNGDSPTQVAQQGAV